MPTSISRLWERIVEAGANFYDFLSVLNESSVRFFESDFAIGLFGPNANFTTVIDKFAIIPFLLMLIGLASAALGQKILPLLKLIFGFVIGFAIGAVYIAPVVTDIVPIGHLIVGLAFGIVIAVFKTPLYYISLVSTLLYSFYYACVNALHFSAFWAFAVALVAVVLILIFLLKWVEVIGTALLGGWLFSASLGLLIPYNKIVYRIILFFIAVLGFLVQLKYPKKKKNPADKKKKGKGDSEENDSEEKNADSSEEGKNGKKPDGDNGEGKPDGDNNEKKPAEG